MSLMIEKGVRLQNANELLQVSLPNQTKTYQPVGHFELVELVKDLASQNLHGYKLVDESYGLNKKGAEMFGHMSFIPTYITPEIPSNKNSKLNLALGLVNSYNKRVRVKFASGAKVVVCDNMLFLGDITYTRKHTPNVLTDVKAAVKDALAGAENAYRSAIRDAAVFGYMETTDDQAYSLLGQLFGKGVFNTPQLNIALSNWHTPTHPEFAPRTLWSLYNSANTALKSSKPDKVLEKHITLHNLFVNYANHKTV